MHLSSPCKTRHDSDSQGPGRPALDLGSSLGMGWTDKLTVEPRTAPVTARRRWTGRGRHDQDSIRRGCAMAGRETAVEDLPGPLRNGKDFDNGQAPQGPDGPDAGRRSGGVLPSA